MSHYISIFAVQSPFPLDMVDPLNRVMFSCNFDCNALYPVASFEYEMAKVISDASLGTLNVDMYIGSQWDIPDGDGPYIGIKNTGGRRDDWSHGGQSSAYQNLSFQTIVRATDYDVAEERIQSIYQLFNGKTKLDVTV